MSLATVIRKMADAGASPEAIAIAVEAIEAEQNKEAARKAKRAEQKRQERDRRATVANTSHDKVSPKKETSPTPPKEKTTPSNFPLVGAREFDQFWGIFPNKVGKRDAERAFANARTRAPLEAIMAGLRRYAAKTDDRPWCNPSTFLNQNRWEDVPAQAPVRQQSTAPPQRERTISDALAEMSAGNWPQEQHHEPFIETSFVRRN